MEKKAIKRGREGEMMHKKKSKKVVERITWLKDRDRLKNKCKFNKKKKVENEINN